MIQLIETTDISLIDSIVKDDDIWKKIANNGINKNQIPVLSPSVLAMEVKADVTIGLHIFTIEKDGVYFHPMILKPYRRRYAMDAIKQGLAWFFENVGDFIMCEIPLSHKSTINLAKKVGFMPIDINNDKQRMRLSV